MLKETTMTNVERFWDLNIFLEDLGHDENGVNQWADVLTINPVIYNVDYDTNRSWNDWTDTVHKATFAETRYILAQRPDAEWGSDWTESLENFLEIAPPRIAKLLEELPKLNNETPTLS
jgi:hypothetical protein